MEFNTDSKAFQNALKALKPFVDPKPHIPILGYVKLESQEGLLSLSAVSGERYGSNPSFTTFKMEVPICPSFSVAIRFDDLNKIATKLKGNIRLSSENGKLHIDSEKLTYTINGKDPMDFPRLTSERGERLASTTIDFRDFQSELQFVLKATEKSDNNHFTNAVLFDYSSPERLRLVGTDGRRLHSTYAQGHCHSTFTERKQWILPVRWIEAFTRLEMRKNVTYPDVIFEFHEDEKLFWRIPSHEMYGMVQCMDTPYPDYENVIPQDRTSTFRVSKKPLLESLDALLPVASQDDGRDMVVVHADGCINLSARSESFGSASAEVACDKKGSSDVRFALNIGYMIETVKLSDQFILLSCSGELEPAVFEYPDTSRIAVVMPVRLPE